MMTAEDLMVQCQCCICQWAYEAPEWKRTCVVCGKTGLQHVESDPCLYPRNFPEATDAR